MANDKVLVKAKDLLEKSASALRKVKAEAEAEREKLAAAESSHARYVDAQRRLFKLASKEVISYEDIPGELDRLAELEPSEQDLELRSMEKAADLNLIKMGSAFKEDKTSSSYSDPITDLVMGRLF